MVDAAVVESARPRFAGLDGLRAFAVVLVVWHNWGALPFTGRFGRVGELRAGYIGVTVFFTISGFVPAVLGALLISLTSWLLSALLIDKKKD